MSKVELTRVEDPREIRITLGENGIPAQRKLVGVVFFQNEKGDNVAENTFERELSAEETAAVVNSAAFAQADALDISNARLAEAREAIAARDKQIAAKDAELQKVAAVIEDWDRKVAPLMEGVRLKLGGIG